jgi:ABC-type branched-subunit amino acid transport system substrate-binding protein
MAFFPLTGTEGQYQPWVNSGEAAAEEINAAGGVNGHPIEIKVCDLGASANTALACGKEAVEEGAAGVFGDPMEASYEPYLTSAHIPIFTDQVDPSEYESEIAFALADQSGAGTAGIAALAKQEGCKDTTTIMAFPGNPASNAAYLKAFVETGERLGSGSGTILAPAESSDFSPYVSKALGSGADCLGLLGLGPAEVGLATAANAAPADVKLITNTGYLTPEAIESLGSVADRLLVTGSAAPATDTKNPVVKQWVESIKKYSSDPKAYDSNGAIAWAEVHALASAAEGIKGEITGEEMLAQLNSMEFNPGIAPPVSFSKPAPSYTPGPRSFGIWTVKEHLENGQIYTDGPKPWFNGFTGEPYDGEVGGRLGRSG